MQLQGVGAIVTGGASGLGAATARELAKAGAKVAIFDMNAEIGEQTAKEIGGVFVKCDVADGPGGEAAVKDAIAKVGPVRVLVNCAGVGTPMKAVGTKTSERKYESGYQYQYCVKTSIPSTEVILGRPDRDLNPMVTLRPPASRMPCAMMAPILHIVGSCGSRM